MPSPNYTVHHRMHVLNLNLALGGLSLVLDRELYNFFKKQTTKKRLKKSLGKILLKMGVFKSRIKSLLGFGERKMDTILGKVHVWRRWGAGAAGAARRRRAVGPRGRRSSLSASAGSFWTVWGARAAPGRAPSASVGAEPRARPAGSAGATGAPGLL